MPNTVDALLETARIARDQLNYAGAEEAIKQAFTVDRHAPRVWYQLGILRMHTKDYAAALGIFAATHEALPNSHEPCYLAGLCANNLGQYEASLIWLRRATKRHERFEGGDAWAAYGNALYLHGKPAEGWAAHDRALKCKATDAISRFMQSWIYLLRGDFKKGFDLYESRWEVGNHIRSQYGHRTPLDDLPPRWTGIEEGRVLIYSEQGSGDTIQMSRYFDRVWQASKHLPYVMCQPELVPLFAGWDARPSKSGVPEADYSIPMFSLPKMFGVVPADLESTLGPLPAPLSTGITSLLPELEVNRMYRSVNGLEPELTDPADVDRPFRVGLCWQGSKDHANDHDRSMPDEALAGLWHLPIEFVNLTYGMPLRFTATQVTSEDAFRPKDYAETARIISGLDAVVSVDTSVGHLSATLGVPTLMLLQTAPEWRWALPPATTTPWYDSMTLIRRRDYKDWSGAIAQVVEHLSTMQRGQHNAD